MSDTVEITIDERWLAETERLAGDATAGPWKYELTDEGTVGVVFDSGHSVAWDLEGTCARCFGTMEHIARVDPAAVRAWCAETRRLMAEVQRLRGLLWRYGWHLPECQLNRPRTLDQTCDCGFDAALAAAPAPARPAE